MFQRFILITLSIFYVSISKAQDIDIISYRAKLKPDLNQHTVSAKVEINLIIKAPIKKLEFPAKNLIIQEVQLSDERLTWRQEGNLILVTSRDFLKEGKHLSINIKYNGTPKGITFGEDYIYSNYDSCSWLLCKDHSGDRFSIDLSIKSPANWNTIMSFTNSTQNYPGFLIGFASGRFQVYEKENLAVYSTIPIENNVTHIIKKTTDALRFFEKKSGFSLPSKQYSQIVVPERIAQEKSNFSLLGYPFLKPMFKDKKEDWLIVHELAHQWWGNSIICNDWSHFWLNEGITTFMVAAYKEYKWGKDSYNREIDLAKRRYQFAINQNFDVPLSFSGEYPNLGIKRAITYSKGFLFIDELRNKLGEDKFWKAIRDYSIKYKNKNVTSKLFQSAIEKSAKEELSELFKKWVY